MDKSAVSQRKKPNPKGPALFAGGVVVLLGLCTGGVMMLPADANSHDLGPITVQVEGAIGVSVYCGGEETAHADGASVSFTPEGVTCFVEAPLTPAMPLRGTFELAASESYRCVRDNVSLVCEGV